MLLTIEEARRVLIASAGELLAKATCTDTGRLEEALWGRDRLEGESPTDQALAWTQRRVLAHLEALGYGGDAADQLEGVCSAGGLAEGRRDFDFLADVLGDEGLRVDTEPFWSWLLAA